MRDPAHCGRGRDQKKRWGENVATLEEYKQAGKALYDSLHLDTIPVAITYIKDLAEIPEKVMRPSARGEEWSLCQAFTYARRWGWTVAMTGDDNFCVPSSGSHGWEDISAEDLFESQIRQGWHCDAEAEKRVREATREILGEENLRKTREYIGFVVAPLPKVALIPDTVLVYANGQQITHIIQALVWEGKNFPTSTFTGFGESCFKGGLLPFLTGTPQIVIPGTGDRAFSGVFDSEIAIGIPASLVFEVNANMFKTGGRQNMGQPVKTLLPRGIKAKLTPGFAFLREKIDESKKRNEK